MKKLLVFIMCFFSSLGSANGPHVHRVLGEKLFEEKINIERFKKDLEVITNLDDVEDGVVLFAIFRRHFFRYLQGDFPERAQLNKHVIQVQHELEKKLYQEYLRDFVEKQGRAPTKKEQDEQQEQAKKHFVNLLQMNPREKLKRIIEMERIYLKQSSEDDEKTQEERERRRILFEIARDESQEELYVLVRKRRSEQPWWKRHKHLLYGALAIAGAYAVGKGVVVVKEKFWSKEQQQGPTKEDQSKLWFVYGKYNEKEKKAFIEVFDLLIAFKNKKKGVADKDLGQELKSIFKKSTYNGIGFNREKEIKELAEKMLDLKVVHSKDDKKT